LTEPDPAAREPVAPPAEAAAVENAVESVPAEIAPVDAGSKAAESATLPAENVPPAAPVVHAEHCLNCDAVLTGLYCSQCGQRVQLRRLSVAALSRDLVHDLVDLDSRVWRTLHALLFQPGQLTNEYISGRRTLYTPPFRLYLVLSLVYFVLPSFKHETATFNVSDDNKVVVTDMQSREGQQAIKDAMQELQQDVGRAKTDGVEAHPPEPPTPSVPASPATAPTATAAGATSAPDSPATTAADAAKTNPDPDTDVDENARLLQGMDCTTLKTDLFGGKSGWLQPRLVAGCQHLQTVTQREFMRALRNNIPKMMFIFLPLIALVNLVLYAFRRRTYVEHLLFYVHCHAFAFLLLTLQVVVTAILSRIGGFLSVVSGLVSFAVFVYLFVYLFKAMRSVYHQSRIMTTLKYVVVLASYGVCLLLTLIGMGAYTAFTV
jgi:hypothetical protein